MSDDLVKRLRSGNTMHQTWLGLCEDAADRIEALTAEALDWRAQVGELSDKVKALTAAMESARIEDQAAAIDAALAELDAIPILNAHICEAKWLLRGARKAMK